jgi:8-oxo-dGTP diphosphatase
VAQISDKQIETVLFVGVVVKRGEEVLLVRQAPGHPLEGKWTVPWGRVEAGESPMSAAIREVREEAGVEASVEGLLGVQELPAPQAGAVALLYLCKHLGGDLRPRDRETDAAGYYSRAALDLCAGIEPWSEWLVRRVFAGNIKVIPCSPGNPLNERGAFL